MSLEEQVEACELQARVAEALRRLRPRDRALVVLKYYLDLDTRELGEAIGAPTGTIKWMLHAARRRLRQWLGERSAG